MGQTFSFPLPKVIAETSAARVTIADEQARFSLRAGGELAPLNAALGLTLPSKIGACVKADIIEVACLGPDEWVVLSTSNNAAILTQKLGEIYPTSPHSVTDISTREMTFEIAGPKAADLMTIGCPRDVDIIPVGSARRTVFDGATVVLWKDGPNLFRMDVWNSFAPYLAQLLETGAKELALETA